MNDVVIRFATPEDVTPILILLEQYFKESMYIHHDPMDPELSVIAVATYIEAGDSLVAEVNGEIKGVLLCMSCVSFWKRAEIGIDVFFVDPEWRGTPMGNKLIEGLVQIIKKRNYMFGIGASTSGFGHVTEKCFENTLVKHGFTPLGRACAYFNPNTEEQS